MATKKTTKENTVKTLVLRGPRLTEKATRVSENNVYTFNVDPSATKPEIKKAIISLYGVTPVKIAISNRAPQTIFVRGKIGKTSGRKKAMVYLKKGDTIEFA
jgi:large subunit ribosomal protein L23